MTSLSGFLARLIAACVAVTITLSIACAQTVPAPAVRIVVPCPIGSPADIFARHLAQVFAESSGRQFYVENVVADAGKLGTAEKAQIDGDRIFFGPTLSSSCGD